MVRGAEAHMVSAAIIRPDNEFILRYSLHVTVRYV
jgi:hypothetical protein